MDKKSYEKLYPWDSRLDEILKDFPEEAIKRIEGEVMEVSTNYLNGGFRMVPKKGRITLTPTEGMCIKFICSFFTGLTYNGINFAVYYEGEKKYGDRE